MSGPLKGVRVIDVSFNLLGPSATQILGDLGADVIKIEPPSGDANRHSGPYRTKGMSALYMSNNRNKRSVVLDLKTAADRDTLYGLVESADVFVHSMRVATAQRLGIGYADISARNPRIVYAFGAGFDQDGAHRDRPAFDDVIQGECGLVALTEQATGKASFVPTALVDKLVGQMLSSGIAMALFHRERTGEGQQVHVPMYESMVAFLFAEHLWGGTHRPPSAELGYSRIMKRRPFPTSDGHICVTAISDKQWSRLFEAVERPDLATDARFAELGPRNRHFDELFHILEERFRTRPTARWIEILNAADIPNGGVKSLDAVYEDAYLAETGFWVDYDHPTEGACRTTAIPIRFSRTPGALRRHPPTLGEHTDEVLGDNPSSG